MAEVSRSVAKKVQAFETSEGAGATVRRSIGSMNLHRLDPFLVLDHFYLPPGSGFPDHPHRGQATVTYMFEGSVQHEDSAGHKGTIGPGDLQWMIAGKGMPVHGPGLPNPTGLQLWIDLPKADKMTAPSYQELVSSQVPTAYPLGPDGPVEVKVISGKSFGVESPVRHLGGCWYLDIKLKAGEEGKADFFQDIPQGWTAFLYTIEGNLLVNNQSIDKHYTVVLSAEENEAGILLSLDGDQDARVVLIAGAPLNQPVFQYGPFVMNTKEEIMATILDYDGQRNGFEKSKTWKSSIGGR
ncbi:hypothetical protein FRC04_011671 [Tulasnella sp. 424]|nr:hypothetical protein FRC04_011671 [Tulasnella sp. 424]KAG8971489.1 hypothetical protein FRC05_011062 [Tulasnella sp. 425]